MLFVPINSRDYDVYMLKFMEFHMMGRSLTVDINDDLIPYFMSIFASELFDDMLDTLFCNYLDYIDYCNFIVNIMIKRI